MANERMWVEQEDSGREVLSALGGSEYILVFETNRGDGKREFLQRGYKFGAVFTHDGSVYTLATVHIVPRGPNERVEIIYRTADYQVGSTSRDGRIHQAGDEEFELECQTEQVNEDQAISRGLILSGTWPTDSAPDTLPIGVAYLVWRKWLPAKGEVDAKKVRIALPSTLVGAAKMAMSYVRADDGWEENPPILNSRRELVKAAVGQPGLLGVCKDVRIIPDGSLLLREARLQIMIYSAS